VLGLLVWAIGQINTGFQQPRRVCTEARELIRRFRYEMEIASKVIHFIMQI